MTRPLTKLEALRRFVRKLEAAHGASKAVDYFDLYSEDKENAARFYKLEIAQWKTATALIRFAQEHGEAAIEGLKPEKKS